MSPHAEIYVESTEEGIRQVGTLTDVDSDSEDDGGADSKIEKKLGNL
jgi:hypothetical protein